MSAAPSPQQAVAPPQHEPAEQHEPPPDLVCSARACTRAAAWGLRWNNPSLHTPERRKVWLACDEHRVRLEEHLSVRGFLRETVPASELTAGRS